MSRHSTFLCWFLEEEDTQLKMLQDAGKKHCLNTTLHVLLNQAVLFLINFSQMWFSLVGLIFYTIFL